MHLLVSNSATLLIRRRVDQPSAEAPPHAHLVAHLVGTIDITYLPTREGWLYLAVVLDLFGRRVVGWSMQPSLERSLVLAALNHALQRRRPPPGLLHHSDRGSQYASGEYQACLLYTSPSPRDS